MSGCGGNCTCRKITPHDSPRTSLLEIIARVSVDAKVIERTVELYEMGVVRVEDLVAQINADKNNGLL